VNEELEKYMAKAKNNNNSEEPIEKQLWKAADKLRKNIDAAEYKHIILGLIFLKYISDAFEELFSKLKTAEGEYAGADPEDKDEYKAENVFFVPEIARWSYLQSKAKLPDDEDDFNERCTKLKAGFEAQLKEEKRLNDMITENLGRVKLP
jgi:type I restriction enzyme M protein